MSNHFKEARDVTQAAYGYYCNVIRGNGMTPVPYEQFKGFPHIGEMRKQMWIESTKAVQYA